MKTTGPRGPVTTGGARRVLRADERSESGRAHADSASGPRPARGSDYRFPQIFPDYHLELAEYQAGRREHPPCETCACPNEDAPFHAFPRDRLCLDCLARLHNILFLAPRAQSGKQRHWKLGGRSHGERLLLVPCDPNGLASLDWLYGGGGVRALWRTLDELRQWRVAS